MTLTRRILIGMAPLLLIFLSVGIYAIYLFSKLGGAIDVILRENYASVVASHHMEVAAERMDSGLLFALNGEEERGRALFKQFIPEFEKNSAIEAKNITLPGEGDLERRIDELHGKYLVSAHQFFALAPSDPLRRSLYFNDLLTVSSEVKATAEQILELNQNNMVFANNQARDESRNSSRLMIGALIGGLLTATIIAYYIAQSIVRPIANLTESAQQLGDGNLDQHVPVSSSDELSRLGLAFNKLATKLRAYRQSTTEQILQAQQTTENALQAFPDPIIVLSMDKGIQLQNKAAERFLKLIGGDLNLLKGLQTYVDQSLRGSADFTPTSFDKAILVTSDEGEKFYLPRVMAMRNESGTPFGVVVALQDVTRFRVADDVKTDWIATVSHELKTPLTSMQMAVYLLLEEKVGPLNGKQTELLLAARNNSDRLFDMVENLLDLARFEGGAALLDKKPISSHELIQEIVKRERELITSRGLQLEVTEEPNLPSIVVSRPRIDQVFANFFSNAVKHSPAGGTIKLSAVRENAKSVRFSVRDEGKGIPKEFYRKIFDKFFRVSEIGGEGVGLGLSIAREVVLAHGGDIGVKGNNGKGSEFYFTLPILT
jgi:NtrC-family two-component system sensor histidine kinase KinB